MADGLDRLTAAGRHTRRPEQPQRPRRPAGLGRLAAAALVMLALQYALGMILNFYVGIPAADAHAGIVTEITTAPLALTMHALLGVSLIGTAILLVARALRRRDRMLAVLAAAGLAAIVGAFVAGEMFVKNGQDSTSFAMAMLTAAALLCYAVTLALSSGRRPVPERETQPLLASVPAARTGDLTEYPDDWGAEPGWDDDPDWAGRLRQDADLGWPGRPGPAERPAWPQRLPVRPPSGAGPARPMPAQHRTAQQRPVQHWPVQGPPDWWEHP